MTSVVVACGSGVSVGATSVGIDVLVEIGVGVKLDDWQATKAINKIGIKLWRNFTTYLSPSNKSVSEFLPPLTKLNAR